MKHQTSPEHKPAVAKNEFATSSKEDVARSLAALALLGIVGGSIYSVGSMVWDEHKLEAKKKHDAYERTLNSVKTELRTQGASLRVSLKGKPQMEEELPAITFDNDQLAAVRKQQQKNIDHFKANKLGAIHRDYLPDDFYSESHEGGISFIPGYGIPGTGLPGTFWPGGGSYTEDVNPVRTYIAAIKDIKPQDADDYVVHTALSKLVPGTTAAAFYEPSEHSIFLELRMPNEHKDVELTFFAEKAE